MAFKLCDVLTIRCGIDERLAADIERSCNYLHIPDDGRMCIAQAAAKGAVNKEEIWQIVERAPGMIIQPGIVMRLPMPLSWDTLVDNFRYFSTLTA